jgi:ABC-type branched-subunit amino acid transport system substrate-binding protein
MLKFLPCPRSLFLALVLLGSGPALAQEILVGHVAGYTGPVTKDATEMGAGAQVYFDAVNAHGGVLGRKLRLLVVDDHFKPEETSQLITSLNGKVSALLPTVGSAQLDRVLKDGVFDRVNLPLVGTIPATESFRFPLNRNIFHFRAGDVDQLEKMIDLLTSVGQNKIGVLATNNPNGEQVIAYMNGSLGKRKLTLAVAQKYDIGPKIDFAPIVAEYQKVGPDAIILVGPPFATAVFVKEAKSRGLGASLYGLSYTDFKLVGKVAGGELARGVAIAQVLPNPNNKTMPLVKEFRENFEKYSKVQGVPSHFNLEGYISAKLIVEAMRKSKNTSADGVRRGLEMLREYDLGGYLVDFSPTKHTGSSFVDLSMISASGELIY